MIHIALYQPEIAANTGNIIRLCANIGAQLHLIEPLGFKPDDTKLKRAGLDYHDWVKIIFHKNYDKFFQAIAPKRIFPCSTKGTQIYSETPFSDEDVLLFGPETRGLPQDILQQGAAQNRLITLPMAPNNRSLNLANAVAVIAYEAWRQLDFLGANLPIKTHEH